MFPRRRTGAEARSARLIAFPLAADQVPPREQPILAHLNRRSAGTGGSRGKRRWSPSLDVIFIDHDVQPRDQRSAQAFRWRARPGGARQRAFPLSGYEIGARPARRRPRCGAKNPGRGRGAAAAAAAAPRRRTVLEQSLPRRAASSRSRRRAPALRRCRDLRASGRGSAGLLGQIDELERSVPEVRAPAPRALPPAVSPPPRRTGQG